MLSVPPIARTYGAVFMRKQNIVLSCVCHCRVQAAREERFAAQSSKRQKLREELNKREKQHATGRSEEERAKARLHVSGLIE